ncbi:MAG: hypothetical protein ACM33U_08590 [Solirubrobacterales bacterium]
MSQPSPDERLRERLAHLPDACRALLAALDRAKLRGGGPVPVRLEVDGIGRVRCLEVEEREYRLRA